MFKLVITMLAGSLLLSGCSGLLTIGDEEAYCPGGPSGSMCKGPREIYQLTDNKANLHAEMTESSDEGKTGANSESGSEKALLAEKIKKENDEAGNKPVPTTFANYKAVDDFKGIEAPDPRGILKPPKVMRIYVAAWTDKNNDLHLPGYMYVEVEPERWVVGKSVNKNVNRIVPFSVRKQAKDETKSKMSNPGVRPNGMGYRIAPE